MAQVGDKRGIGKLAWFSLVILSVAYAVAMIDRIVLTLLVEPMKRDLDINDTQFGFLQGFAFAAFYAVAGLPLARLADNSSRKRLIVWGIAFWSFMTSLCALAQSYWQLVLYRIGVGVGEAALTPAAISILSDLFPRSQRTRAIALYASGGTLGAGLAYLAGGAILRVFPGEATLQLPILGDVRGWQVVFLFLGLPGLVLAAITALILREPKRSDSRPREARRLSADLFPFLRTNSGLVGGMFAGFSLLYVVTYGYLAWAPAMLIRTYDVDTATVGFLLGIANIVAGVGGNLAGSFACDLWIIRGSRDAEIRMGLFSAGILFPLCIAIPLVADVKLALALLTILIFFSHFWSSSATAAIQAITPPHLRGQMTSIYILCINILGFGLGPVIVGAITDFVFGTPESVGLSLLIVAATALPLVIYFLSRARRYFDAAILEPDVTQVAA